MADEKASIVITDKVDPNIAAKLRIMAQAAMNANSAVTTLQNSLKSINSNALRLLQQAGSAATRELQQAAIAAARLATEQQRTAAAAARATGAQAQAQLQLQRVTQQLALAAAQLAAAQNRANNAATAGQVAAARLAAQQARVQAQQSAAAAAADRAALAALRLEQAQNRVGSSAGSASSSIRNYVAALASLSSVTSVLKVADTFTTLNNKLRVVAPTQEHVNELMGRLGDLSVNTRSSLESTVTSFARFDRALKLMGKSQEDTLRMTETVNKALIIGGATTQEAASSLLQLSQAFNSGRLQGDEFRSISENMPMVLDAVAKALGTTSDKVKQMSTDGKISSKVMYEAFKIMEAEVDKTFASMNVTIGQSLEILRTKWTLFIGELDRTSGVSIAIGNAIRTLALNLDLAAKSLLVITPLMIAAFGPKMLSAVNLLTVAVGRLNLIISRNPIGMLLAALVTAGAGAYVFAEQLGLIDKELENVSDSIDNLNNKKGIEIPVPKITWVDEVEQAFENVQMVLVEAFEKGSIAAVASWEQALIDIPKMFSSVITGILKGLNDFVQQCAIAFERVKAFWLMLNTNLEKYFFASLNSILGGFNLLIEGYNYFAKEVGKEIPLLSIGSSIDEYNSGLKEIESNYQKARAEILNTDFTENAAKNVQTMFSGISENLKTFSDNAKKTWADLRKDLQQEAFSRKQTDAIMDALTNTGSKLRGAGSSQLGEAAAKGGRTKKTSGKTDEEKRVDFLKKINLELDNEIARFGVLGPLREMQAKYDAIQEKMAGKGWTLSEKENQSLRDKIELTQRLSEIQKHLDSIYNETAGKIRNIKTNQDALNIAQQTGLISSGTYSAKMLELKFALENTNAEMGKLTTEGFATLSMEGLMDGFKGNISDLTTIFSDFYSGMADGFANSIGQMIVQGDSLKDSLLNVAQTITQSLITALVKLGVQYAVNAALQTSTQQASTAQSVAAASETTAAWAPAAAVTSAASWGGAAIAGGVALLAIMALAKGFKSGGYTGGGGVSDIAGVVHGQEFVMNAAATQRIGVPTLQALQDGASLQSVSSSSNNVGFGEVNVTIENYGVSKDFEVQQLSETDVRIIARDEANTVVENKAESVVANKLTNANSTMSKALANNLNVTRKR